MIALQRTSIVVPDDIASQFPQQMPVTVQKERRSFDGRCTMPGIAACTDRDRGAIVSRPIDERHATGQCSTGTLHSATRGLTLETKTEIDDNLQIGGRIRAARGRRMSVGETGNERPAGTGPEERLQGLEGSWARDFGKRRWFGESRNFLGRKVQGCLEIRALRNCEIREFWNYW